MEDSITLAVESESKNASVAINNVIKDLKTLQNVMKDSIKSITSVSESLKNMSESFNTIKITSDIKQTTSAIKDLNEASKNTKSPFSQYGSEKEQLQKLGLPELTSNFYTLQSSVKDATSETSKYITKNGQIVTVSKQTKDGLEGVKIKLKEVNDEVNRGNTVWDKLGKVMTSSIAKLAIAYHSIKRIGNTILSITDSATNYEEALNLFTVTMGTQAQDATKWVEKFSKALYIDDSGLMQYMGSLNSLISGLGVASDKSYLMSKNLTQLVYDLASFKNLDIETSFRKIQSAMSGEIEPLRNVGVALSQNTLQELANQLGIKRRVAEMSEAEKAQLRYVQILRSTTEWQGDMGRTLVSPANAVRVLKQQFTLLGRAIGRIFIPFVMKAIPYVIALSQILTDLGNKIAAFFGYEITDIDYSSLTDVKAAVGAVGDEADSTTKKLNTMLAPFDELNVVQSENKKSDSGSGGLGGDLGIDLPEYDALAGLTKDMADNVARAKKKFKEMLPIVEAIAGIITTYKVIKTLGNVAQWLSGTSSAVKNLASLFGFKGKGSATSILNSTLQGTQKTAGICKDTESKFKLPKWSTIIQGLGELALIVTAVIAYVGVLGLFMKIPGVKSTIEDGVDILEDTFNGIARVIIPIAAVSAGIVALGNINVSQVAIGLANMGVVILGTEAVILAVGVINKLVGGWLDAGIEGVKKTFNGIADIALPLVGVSAALALAGLAGGAGVTIFATGLADLATIIGGTTVLLTAIGTLLSIPGFKGFLDTGIDSVKRVFEGLYDIAIPLGIFTGYIVVLGFATPATILSGLTGFAEIIGGISLVLVALGALNQIPGFDWIIGEGGEVLQHLGDILGGFVGSIVAGFVGKVTSKLPKVGTDLSNFMKNAQPFFEQSGKIDKNTMKGLEYLVNSILKLTAANILDSVTKWLTGGKSMVKFGKELAEFAPYFKTYANEVKDIDSKVVEGTSNAVKSIIEFARKVPNEGGMISWFTGDNTLDKFGSYLPSFGKNLKSFYYEVKNINSDIVTKSADAALSVIEFARKVPNDGGMISWFTGDNKLGKFSEYLPTFAKNFKSYYEKIKNVEPTVITKSSDAVDSIMQFAKAVPNEGGLISWFTGDNNIAKFGSKLSDFGQKFKEYYNKIANIDINKVNAVSDSISKLVDMARKIKDNNLTSAIKDFGNGLKGQAGNFSKFFERTFGTDGAYSLGYDYGKDVGKGVKDGMKAMLKLKLSLTGSSGNEISSFNLTAYGTGGFPETGELFLARESGAEMIGKIGNQTAVANNDQITTGIKNAVIEAFSSINLGGQPSTTVVNIGGRKVYEGIGNYINSENDRYGTNYVNV